MRLLHGSNVEVKKPDLAKCQSSNDFGKGFYLTPSWTRAWEMGKRKVRITEEGEISVSAFSFDVSQAEKKGLKLALFQGFSVDWARFVISNRDNAFFHHDFDVVIGPVADAILDQEIFMHKKQYGNRCMEDEPLKAFIGKVSQFGSSYVQYCFCTQKALNELKKI